MKSAILFHNPSAGEKDYSEKELLSIIHKAGFECSYRSTKEKGWEKPAAFEPDLIIMAGGDGTVRKVSEELLTKNIPIGLLPLGTANNIAKTLGIQGNAAEIIQRWNVEQRKKYDVGKVFGLDKKAMFFLEGFGYGIFPRLMKEMKNVKEKSPEENIQTALKVLHDIILTYEARECSINIDDTDYSGKFLLAEVMNIRSIGPNLNLAPMADPGDGELEVVLITERQRNDFAAYVLNKIKGIETPPFFNILKAKKLTIMWDGDHLHIDDERVTLKKPTEVKIILQEGMLEFLVPN